MWPVILSREKSSVADPGEPVSAPGLSICASPFHRLSIKTPHGSSHVPMLRAVLSFPPIPSQRGQIISHFRHWPDTYVGLLCVVSTLRRVYSASCLLCVCVCVCVCACACACARVRVRCVNSVCVCVVSTLGRVYSECVCVCVASTLSIVSTLAPCVRACVRVTSNNFNLQSER